MTSEETKFPKVQGGGSLILAWQIRNKHVLVVGGGEVAAGRILNVLNADADVTVVCPSSGLNAEVRHRIAQNEVAHIDRVFQPSDLDALPPPPTKSNSDRSSDNAPSSSTAATATPRPPDMVLVAIDDPAASSQIWKLCKERRISANIADVPSECDFYFGSVHRDGPLQIMVSTNGKGPRLASSIRKWIAGALPRGAGDAVERVGALRRKLREVAPDSAEGPRRMRWMTRVSDAYSWDEMCTLSDEDLDNLLKFYAENQVPSFDVLVAMRGGHVAPEDIHQFDGSFGFSVGI